MPTNVIAQDGDFEISVYPESQTINPGGLVTFLVTVTSIDDFDSSVDLSVEGLPDDTTASFDPNPVAPKDNYNSILTISTSENTPTGSCSITIIGTSGVLERSTSTTIEIDYGLLPKQFGTFTGRVTSCDNPEDGIEGVTVRACEYDSPVYTEGYEYTRDGYGNEGFTCYYTDSRETITNENGYYTITDVPLGPDNAPREFVVAFHIEGYSATHHFATASAGTITTVDMELCHAGIIGTVVDADTGNPIEGAEIYTYSDPSSEISGSYIKYAYAITDENGEYTLYNMPLGADNGDRHYGYVRASAPGYCYHIESIDITSGSDYTLEFSLIFKKYGTFEGRVTSCDNPGEGIEGVTVLACAYDYWGYEYARNEYGNEGFTCHYNCGGLAITNENGYYTIENVPLGNYPNCNKPRYWAVSFHIAGYSETHHIATAKADTPTIVDIELCHAGIIGTVVVDDETGDPIEGAEIYAYSCIGGSLAELWTTTNAEGVYNLPNIPLGADNGYRGYYPVTASAEGYCEQTKTIEITSGSTSTLSFSLTPIKYGTFTGQVTDLDTGESIAGVNVYAVEYENVYNGYLHTRSNGWEEWKEQKNGYMLPPVTADSNGYYTIENVPLGDYPNCNNPSDWVVVSHIEGYSATHHIATAVADIPTIVDMKLCHAGITGTVVDAETEDPIEGAFITAYSGIPGSEVYAYAHTNEDGIYSLLNLPVGADHEPRYYRVTATAAGYCPQTKYGDIFCGGVITLDFAGPEKYFGTIYGTVTDCITEAPIEGAFVGGQFGDYTFTNDLGQYIFTDVPVEPDGSSKIWEVTASADGYESKTKEVEVFADEISILDFCLLPPFQLFYLTVDTNPVDLTTFEEEGWYDQGTGVELNAPSIEGYTFLYWDVDGANEDYGENPITVTMDSDHTATAHYFEWFKIYGHKYFDGNGDGTWNNDEPYLDGWTINLDDTDSAITGDGTWDTGYYEFTIKEPGNYMVSEETSDIWTKTEPASDYHQVIAQSGVDVELNFGNWFEGGFITDSSLCYFDADDADGQQFRLLFTPDINNDPSLYKVTATNPGQFYYHVFYSGQDITDAFEITIADNFETQGATPVHVYSSLNVGPGGCIIPGNDVSNDFDIVINGNSITVTPPSEGYDGFIYINVHCDYALKQTYEYELEYYDDEGVTRGNAIKDPDEDSIYDMTTYTFSVAGPDSFADQDTIQNRNEFKKFRGIVGFLTDSSGDPIEGSEIIITGPYIEGGFVNLETDSDGFYGHSFFHKGKPKTYSVEFVGYTTIEITLKAGHFAEVSYQVT